MSTRADEATRFRSAFRDDELPDAIIDVARAADPDDPQSVSTRRWDAHRAAAGHPNAPSARQIVARLNTGGRHVLSWPRIVELSFGSPEQRQSIFTTGARRPEQHHLTVAHLEVTLRRAARHLNQPTLSSGDYGDACNAILAALSGPARAVVERQLPTVGQIERIARHARTGLASSDGAAAGLSDWDYALVLACLQPTSDGGPRTSRRRAMELVEMIGLFAGLAGALPTRQQARRFAERQDIALRDVAAGRTWEDYIAEFTEQLRAAGDPVPPGPFARRRYTITVPEDVLAELPRRHKRLGRRRRARCA